MPKTILILGSYDNTGVLLARWLLQETDAPGGSWRMLSAWRKS